MSNSVNFKSYIYKLLKINHPDNGINETTLICLDNVVKFIIKQLMISVNQITLHTKKKTIGHQEVYYASLLCLPDNLSKKATDYASEAVKNFNEPKIPSDKKISKNVLAKLTFPISRIQTYMMPLTTISRKSDKAVVYMTSICEFMILEILNLASAIAKENKKARITVRHVTLAVLQNEDMKCFYKTAVFSGGVLQHKDKK